MNFDTKACKKLLLSRGSWDTIEEAWEAVKNTEGIVAADFKEAAYDLHGKQKLRSVLNEEDPETGLPIGVSIVGDDGQRRYKSPRLFDDSDWRKGRQYHVNRAAHHCRMVRKFEYHGGMEQLSLDFGWIDEAEDAA